MTVLCGSRILRWLIVTAVLLLSACVLATGSCKEVKRTSIATPAATAEVLALRAQVNGLLKMRVAYGELYCKLHGIGPSGGFCVKDTSDVGGNSALDEPVCALFAKMFASKSVLDLGCGLGQYGRCLRAAGTGVRWTGLDGSEGIENATGESLLDLVAGSTPQTTAYVKAWYA